jgi:hypothetical protein
MKNAPKEAEPEEAEKKDPRGTRFFECSRFGHIRADCGNLKKGKGKAYNVTLSDDSEEEEAPVIKISCLCGSTCRRGGFLLLRAQQQ